MFWSSVRLKPAPKPPGPFFSLQRAPDAVLRPLRHVSGRYWHLMLAATDSQLSDCKPGLNSLASHPERPQDAADDCRGPRRGRAAKKTMRRVAVALLCATGSALVAPPTARRPSALAASATAEVPVKTFDGADSGKATLSLKVTKGEKDMYVVHRKYVLERRNARAGTASTKTRSEVRGGGRKPFKQKGTGRARQGSIRSPLKVGGGVSFGPKPKDWANKKMNRKEAELAIGIAIQNKASRVTVVDSIAGKFSEPKTKNVVSMLSGLGLDADAKTVLVYDQEDATFEKSASNLPNCELRLQDEITVSDMLWADQVLMTQPAFDWVNERYGE